MAAFVADAPERLIFTGPDVVIASDAYASMALIAHGSITNSVKYGALSHPHGVFNLVTPATLEREGGDILARDRWSHA